MITYLIGDATQPLYRPAIIAHICNSVGGWGRGFVMAVSKRWSSPERIYRMNFKQGLGTTLFAQVEPDLWVANMIAQFDIGLGKGCLIDWSALDKCLAQVREKALELKASVSLPRIAMGLGGCRHWSQVREPLEKGLRDVNVFVYDFLKKGETK